MGVSAVGAERKAKWDPPSQEREREENCCCH